MKAISIISLLVTLVFANSTALGVNHSILVTATSRSKKPTEPPPIVVDVLDFYENNTHEQPPLPLQTPKSKDITSEEISGQGDSSVEDDLPTLEFLSDEFIPHLQSSNGVQQDQQFQGHRYVPTTTLLQPGPIETTNNVLPQESSSVILPQPVRRATEFQSLPTRATIQPNVETTTRVLQVPLQFGYGACTPPRHVLDLTWDSDAYRNHQVETFYTPLSHSQIYNSFYKTVTGFNLRLNDAFNDLCLTTAFNWKDYTAVVTTFGVHKKNFNCTYINGGYKFAFECTPVEHRGESFRIYFTKSDNRSYLVAYHCWESGSVEWFSYSNNVKSLSETLKQEILLHVKTLGFDPEEYKEANYEHCFPDSGEDAKPPVGDNIRDSCDISANIVTENNWESTESCNARKYELFYIPMAHELAYIKLNNFIDEEYIGTQMNLSNFCIMSKRQCHGGDGSLSAFNRESPFQCLDLPNYFGNNRNAWVTSCQNQEDSRFTSFVTKTDYRTYRLSQQCWKSGDLTWTVESTTPTLPNYLRGEILEHVTSLGFYPQDAQYVNYDLCKNQSHDSEETLKDTLPPDEQKEDLQAEGNGLFSKCSSPPKFFNDLFFDSPLNKLKQTEEFYIPMVQKDGYGSIEEFVIGNHFSTELTGRGFCPKYEFDWNNYETRFLESRNQDRTDRLNCTLLKHPNNSQKGNYEQDCYNKNGEAIFRSYVTLSDDATYAVMKLCWKSGQTFWMLISSEQDIPEDVKVKVLDHVAELGFNASDYQKVSYDSCPGEERRSRQSEQKYEPEESTTELFSKCSPPSSYLKRNTWESSSNREGVEFFDVAMAHINAATVYRQSVGITQNITCNYRLTKHLNCLRSRMDYKTNTARHIGYGDVISDEFTCTYAPNQEWIHECVSKTSPELSYRSYSVKSDNVSWMLTYQCLNSDTVPASWTLWVAPGTVLSSHSKCKILRMVQKLGFNPFSYVEFGSDKCTYSNKLFTKQPCY